MYAMSRGSEFHNIIANFKSRWSQLAVEYWIHTHPKGQLISKANYGLLTSPKKRTTEFVLFAFLLFTSNKTNSFVCFLGVSTARKSVFGFI